MSAALVLPRIAGYDFEVGADLGNAAERAQLSSAAIRAFINIARKWKLNEEQSRALLGGLASSTYHAWRLNPKRTLDQDTLTRISLLIGIYKALHIYFGKAWADRWVTLENRGPLFAGRTPVAFMMQRGQPGMIEVRRMLDTWRGGR
jgi:Antitoxin Xre-like helix-turn-helix domain/Antitoxin Xre/MbcA/ParS C-terminal toxin-binding domain